jgi:hypothetical protein
LVKLAKITEALIDENPPAFPLWLDFAFAIVGAATRTIHETLGTLSEGADTGESPQLALATQEAFLLECIRASPHKSDSINAGIYRLYKIEFLFEDTFTHGLQAVTACEHENPLGLG